MRKVRAIGCILSRIMFLAALLAVPAAPAWAVYEERATFSVEQLRVRNVIGEIRIEPHAGSDFEVLVTVDGKDAREDLIKLERSEDSLEILFPAGQREYVYPRLGAGSDSSFKSRGGDRLKIRGAGSGMELWADVTVRVPNGTSLEVEHGVGKVLANGVDADLELSTRSGNVMVENTRGGLSVATGSGDVDLLRVDAQRFEVATGSGDVKADDCDGQRVQIATGSGDVSVAAIRGGSMEVATGSGDIEAQAIGADEISVGTGSGNVRLELDRVAAGDYNVGTGSGNITLTMPAGAAAEVHAETDRGRIRVDLTGDVQFEYQEPEEVRLTVGGGGASVDLGSGSGNIHIQD